MCARQVKRGVRCLVECIIGDIMQRRDFLETMTGMIAATTFLNSATLQRIQAASKSTAHLSLQEAAKDESLWREVQQAFSVNRNVIRPLAKVG